MKTSSLAASIKPMTIDCIKNNKEALKELDPFLRNELKGLYTSALTAYASYTKKNLCTKFWTCDKFALATLELNPHLIQKFYAHLNPNLALMHQIISTSSTQLFIDNFRKFTVEERAYLIHNLRHEARRNV